MPPINDSPDSSHNKSGAFPFPFETLEPRFIVTIQGGSGLHEVLAVEREGWLLRALNEKDLRLVHATDEEIRGFDLPLHHCFASRDRSLLVALVNGDAYDVTQEHTYDESLPLFQAVHARDLIVFAELAWAAGFRTIELTNGLDAWEGCINELIAQCETLAADAAS